MTTTEARLRIALSAAHGLETGREAAAEALAYGWEHWDRIQTMENPAGYLYRVGQNQARRMRPKQPLSLPAVDPQREPWVEPGLPAALAKLPNSSLLPRPRRVYWGPGSGSWLRPPGRKPTGRLHSPVTFHPAWAPMPGWVS